MKDLIKRLQANDFASLQNEIEDLAAKKIVAKIREKKEEIKEKMNSAKKSKKG